jgi:flagellar hook-associated protein FlgK
MADIKTALARVINEWEGKADNAAPQPQAAQPTEPAKPKAHLFKATNGVTQATFDLVKANPGITRSQAYRALEQRGYKPSSTASLLTAFILQGQMELTDGKLFTTSNEYTPLKTGQAAKKKAAKIKRQATKATKAAKAAPVVEAGIAALKNPQPLAQVMQRSAIITTNFSVDNILKNLTIMQAKELRDALNNLFK